jgi:hypothetical protein
VTPPILLIAFNRPDTTIEVMKAIRAAKPQRLYVVADGWRNSIDRSKCERVRQIAENAVDWPCALMMRCHDNNLGCRYGPVNAISWFFENENEGIILEDDCLPSISFFRYCAELLEYYRTDNRIMCVTGDRFAPLINADPFSYYFSHYAHCWGWATWRRAWRLYDDAMRRYPEWIEKKWFEPMSKLPNFAKFWKQQLDQSYFKQVQAWDYAWTFSCWSNGGLTCTPKVNLVSNIGFGPDATHCKERRSHWAKLPKFEMDFPLRHPTLVIRNADVDDYVSRHMFKIV